MNTSQEFSLWLEGAPFISMKGDLDFGKWLEGAPTLEQDESGSKLSSERPRMQIM